MKRIYPVVLVIATQGLFQGGCATINTSSQHLARPLAVNTDVARQLNQGITDPQAGAPRLGASDRFGRQIIDRFKHQVESQSNADDSHSP